MRTLIAAAMIAMPMTAFAQSPSLQIDHVWSRAAPAGHAGVVYLTITDTGPADTLTGVATPVAAMADLHETVNDNGVMKMRPVASLPIEPGKPVTLPAHAQLRQGGAGDRHGERGEGRCRRHAGHGSRQHGRHGQHADAGRREAAVTGMTWYRHDKAGAERNDSPAAPTVIPSWSAFGRTRGPTMTVGTVGARGTSVLSAAVIAA